MLSLLIALTAMSQDISEKYLAGAVPEVNGKVVFTKKIKVNAQSSDIDIFNAMTKWAYDNYNTTGILNNRVLLSDQGAMNIACSGEKYLIFKSGILALDRAKMSYQLILKIDDGACEAMVRSIKYDYEDNRNALLAEEMITDKHALSKDGDKLNRYYDKFRIHTIDSINGIFKSIDVYLNGVTHAGAVGTQPAVVVEKAPKRVVTPKEESTAAMSGFKKVTADKVPASILNKDAFIVTGTVEKPTVFTASWGGTTTLLDKLMGLTTAPQGNISNNQVYTISFYTEMYSDAIKGLVTAKGDVKEMAKKAGLTPVTTPSGVPVFGEAWMVIECKKAGEMPSSGSTITDLGEILNVWVK